MGLPLVNLILCQALHFGTILPFLKIYGDHMSGPAQSLQQKQTTAGARDARSAQERCSVFPGLSRQYGGKAIESVAGHRREAIAA
eukprot:3402305-Amphidinium_carterae.1